MSEIIQGPVPTTIGHPCERGHDFQPRYDLKQANHFSQIVYVRDVCSRCGATVNRPPKRDQGA